MEKSLLLKEDNKEIKLLKFNAGDNIYAVNISDVKEIIPLDCEITRIPNAHPYIEGIIMPRDFLIPIVDTAKSLKLAAKNENIQSMLIVTSINNLNIAFHVDNVVGIQQVSVVDIAKPGNKLTTSVKGVVTGILDNNDKKIEILELRNIISEINPEIK